MLKSEPWPRQLWLIEADNSLTWRPERCSAASREKIRDGRKVRRLLRGQPGGRSNLTQVNVPIRHMIDNLRHPTAMLRLSSRIGETAAPSGQAGRTRKEEGPAHRIAVPALGLPGAATKEDN